ncbi:MAG: hypothetical protein QF664_03420 [Dehalococcoidia bacterium]|jgi:hypothetical protein|nr:hypothetical protein [Dehalococcoidia bacterium]
MRMLSLSHPLPHRQLDNYSIFTAPTIFDYDAIIVDPAAMLATIAEAADATAEHLTHADVAVVNGETTEAGTGLAELLRRRRDEFARALDRGAVVAVFTSPQATINSVSGFSGCDRYFFLPAPAGLGWNPALLRGGEGTAAIVHNHAHTFAPVIDVLRPDLLYRAYFDDRVPGFAQAASVFARSPGGAPLGVEFAVGNGSVIFLPARKGRGGSVAPAVASAIVEAMQARLAVDDAEQPRWLDQHAVAGLAEREAAVTAASDHRDGAEAELTAAESAAAELALVRDVLWRGGEHSLQPVVVRCFELLGFNRRASDRPLILHAPRGALHVEVAASRDAVDMAAHYRLRARLDDAIERELVAPRGIVVANGQRMQAPADRDAPYEPSLRIAAEATGYALLTADRLFEAATSALDGADDDALAAIRQHLFETDGLVEFDEAMPAGSEQQAVEEQPIAEPADEEQAAEEPEPAQQSAGGEGSN